MISSEDIQVGMSKNGNYAGLCKNKSSLDKMTETDYSTTDDDDSSFDRSQANFEGGSFDAVGWNIA